MTSASASPWPELAYDAWTETRATLHLWAQVVGKIRLAQTPWLNHSWHVPFYVGARGLTTSPIPCSARSFEINFDFIEHVLDIKVDDGTSRRIPLRPQTVADFYAEVIAALGDLRLSISINEMPSEIAGAIPFSRDRLHRSYDKDYAQRFWRVLLQADRVLKNFRTRFIGKCSPVHFFWGSFDLAVTRFSGRTAPPFEGKTPGVPIEVMREAYSHEVSSAGFWPGGNGTDYPAFYSYAYPTPARFQESATLPEGAFFSASLGEFLLPYDVVRNAADPAGVLLANWDRPALECSQGLPRVPRG
jgi:hypothetical protein